jgi:hypothetical protein
MAALRLRLARGGVGASLVARLVRLGTAGVAAEQRRVVLPGRGELALELAPGRWLMEATLPSGESLSESFDVSAAEAGVVELGGPPARAASLGWQGLLGALPWGPLAAPLGAAVTRGRAHPGAQGAGSARVRYRSRRQASELAEPFGASAPDDEFRTLGDPLDSSADTDTPISRGRGATPPDRARDGSPALPEERAASRRALLRRRSSLVVTTQRPDPGARLTPRSARARWADASVAGWRDVHTHAGWEQHVFAATVPRVLPPAPLYLVSRPDAKSPAPRAAAALPWPWPGVAGGAPAEVEVLVSDEAGAGGLSIAVRDARFGPALGYLAAGDLASAALLVDDLVEAAFASLDNPLAAAAIGYMLLGEWQRLAWESKTRRPVWLDWTDALMERAPWLSDGAILRGWLELRGHAGEPDLPYARAAFSSALARGLPYYTAGVRRLYDGLTLLRQSDGPRQDAELERAYLDARFLCLRVDPRQAFTVVELTQT